jgi:hypothetical protein
MHQIAQAPSAARLRDAVDQQAQRLEIFDDLSTFSTLVTQGQRPSSATMLMPAAALAGVLLLVSIFPGRRPEEQAPITRFAFRLSAWATDAALRVCPRGLRVASRLMLPALYRAVRNTALTGIILMTAAFFLIWDRASGGSKPGAIDRMLASSGVTLALMLATVLVPIANGFGIRAAEYVRYVTLPVPTRQLLRRMVLLGVTGAALLPGAVSFMWALDVQTDLAVAVTFAAGVASVLAAGLGAYVTLVTLWWSVWQRIGSTFSFAWIIVPAAILIWQFGLLRTQPGRLASVAGIEVVAALIAAGAAWMAIGRMVDTREPSAGI